MKKHYFTVILSLLFCLLLYMPLCSVSAEEIADEPTINTSVRLVNENGQYHCDVADKLVKKQLLSVLGSNVGINL